MNGFLKSQGYSKAAQSDPARPAESLSFLADAVFKRQFGLKVNSATYIKPAIAYLQVRARETVLKIRRRSLLLLALLLLLLPFSFAGRVPVGPEQRAQPAAFDVQGDRGETVGTVEPRDHRPGAPGVARVQVRGEETRMRPLLGMQYQPQRSISGQ